MIGLRVVICFAVIASFLGCQNTVEIASNPTATGEFSIFEVALILPRAIDADSWTKQGYQGLKLIESELGADIAYAESVPEDKFEETFRDFAEQGYDYIIGHGAQFAEAAESVASDYPKTRFAIVGKHEGNNINFGALALHEGELGYLFGVIAAIKSKTGHISFLGGSENSSNREIITLYERGAMATNPEIVVTTDWVGNFTDTEMARQIADRQIADGVDVIFVLAGAAGMGIHAQAQDAGIYSLAWIEDLNHLAPKAVLTSSIQDFARVLLRGATLARQGRWEGKQYRFGLADGVQYLAPFYGLLTEEEEQLVDSIKSDLLAGKIDVIP